MGNTEGLTTRQQIIELIEHEPGKHRQVNLAEMFGVSKQRISQIVDKPGLKDKLKQPEGVSTVVRAEAMKLQTRVFELYHGNYSNLPNLARAMGISVAQIYRVRQGKRHINGKFIIGAKRAFPGYKLDDLFYVVPGGSQND